MTAVLGAEIVPGSRLVADAVGLSALLGDADIVLTGEGSFDAQSLHGKVIDGVRARARGAAVVVAAGRVGLSMAEVAAAGLTAAVSIARGPAAEEKLRGSAAELVAEATEAQKTSWLARSLLFSRATFTEAGNKACRTQGECRRGGLAVRARELGTGSVLDPTLRPGEVWGQL